MKSLSKKFITAVISGIILLESGFSFAQSSPLTVPSSEIQMQSSSDDDERQKEFWDKFRESVSPPNDKTPQRPPAARKPPANPPTPIHMPPPRR